MVCVGRIRPPFVDDVAHYERLLARQARIETIELPETDPEREGQAILKRIPADAHVCVLDRRARRLRASHWPAGSRNVVQGGRDLCFVIGGPFGLSEPVLERAEQRISLGAITLPHQLARVVLLEQLFRAHKISSASRTTTEHAYGHEKQRRRARQAPRATLVAAAAASVRGSDGEPLAASLERPPRAEFGDYSTNVALLLAPALKAPPREIAEAVGAALSAAARRRRSSASRWPGRASSTCSSRDSWFRRALATGARGRASGSVRARCPRSCASGSWSSS